MGYKKWCGSIGDYLTNDLAGFLTLSMNIQAFTQNNYSL